MLVSAVLGADATPIPLYVAGAASILMAFYCLTLPHTPPPAAGTRPSIGAQISGWVFNAVVPDPAVLEAWRRLWILPGAFAAAVAAIFASGFPTEEAVESTT